METSCRSWWNCKTHSSRWIKDSLTEILRMTITMAISSPRGLQSLATYGPLRHSKSPLISGQSTIPRYTIQIHILSILVASSVRPNMPSQSPFRQIKHHPPSDGDDGFVLVNILPQIQSSSPSQRYV